MSVTKTSGAKPCFLSSLRISFTAAALSRRRCTSRIENLTFVVNGAPRPELPARDYYGHLIEMPSRRWPRASGAKFSGEQRPELQDPSRHRFVGDVQPALREQIFDVAIAKRETYIEADGVPDDRGRKLVAGKRDRHLPSYPANLRTRYRCRDRAAARLVGADGGLARAEERVVDDVAAIGEVEEGAFACGQIHAA